MPNFYFEVLKYMIEEKYENLDKQIFKKFFILCGKSQRLDYASPSPGVGRVQRER